MRGFKNHFYLLLDYSDRNFKIFGCDLKCGHDRELDVAT